MSHFYSKCLCSQNQFCCNNEPTNLHKAVLTLSITTGDEEVVVKADLQVVAFMSNDRPGTPAVLRKILRPVGGSDCSII